MTEPQMRQEPRPASDWDLIVRDEEFKKLMAAKARFIVPATVFFMAFYFALPLLVGYAPHLMSRAVIGPVNLAYLFALSQFIAAWLLAYLYVKAAGRFDKMAQSVLRHLAERRAREGK